MKGAELRSRCLRTKTGQPDNVPTLPAHSPRHWLAIAEHSEGRLLEHPEFCRSIVRRLVGSSMNEALRLGKKALRTRIVLLFITISSFSRCKLLRRLRSCVRS
jgi:hypothetical protein